MCAGPVEREFWTEDGVAKEMGQLFLAVMANLRKLTCREMLLYGTCSGSCSFVAQVKFHACQAHDETV